MTEFSDATGGTVTAVTPDGPAGTHARLKLLEGALQHAALPMLLLRTMPGTEPPTIVYANLAFCERFGYAPDELLGRSPAMLHGAKTDLAKTERLHGAVASRSFGTETVYLYSASGKALLIEIRDRPIDDEHRVMSLRDLTRACELHAQLVTTNDRLRSLHAQNYDAILTLDARGRCIDANVAAEILFGRTREELVDIAYRAAAIGAFFPSDESSSAAFADGKTVEFTNEIRRRDGSAMYVEWRAIPIVTRAKPDGSYLVGRDVTAVRAFTARLAEQARRTHALYLISAARDTTTSAQIDATLRLLLDALDMQCGVVGEIDGESLAIRSSVGDSAPAVGDRVPLADSLVQRALACGDVLTFDDVARERANGDARARFADWHGYIVAPLVIDGRPFGAIGLVTSAIRTFDASDCDFVRLAAVLIAAALERESQRVRLDRLAFSDTLTGLANRAKILAELDTAIERAARHQRSLAIHSIDLDGFKAINDRAGHAMGDLALREVAERLRRIGRAYDVPARYGGDEFLFLQSELERAEDARTFGERLVAHLAEPYRLGDETFDLGASLGIAIYPDDGRDAQALLRKADLALYRAKATGKRRFVLSADLEAERVELTG